MTKPATALLALALLLPAAPALAQVSQQQPPIRATEQDTPAPIRTSEDGRNPFAPDYSVAHEAPMPLQPQAQPVQQPPVQAQAQTAAAPQTVYTPPNPAPDNGSSDTPPPPVAQPAMQSQTPPGRETVVVQAQAAGQPTYRLGTGDKVRVTVFGQDDLSGVFELDGNGEISMPLIGQMKAAGLSTDQLAQAITTRLLDGYLNEPRVSVDVANYRPFYIIGQVNKPGEYAYVNDMSALNAVALAGGYTDAANETTIYIRASGDSEERAVPADATTRIEPGDVVRVAEAPFWSVMKVFQPIIGVLAPFAYSAHL